MKSEVIYSNFPKVREAQKRNERKALLWVRETNRRGECLDPHILSNATWAALARLEEKGLIVFFRSRSRFGYPRGYVARGFEVRRGQVVKAKKARKS